jgi:hypothetical protein
MTDQHCRKYDYYNKVITPPDPNPKYLRGVKFKLPDGWLEIYD